MKQIDLTADLQKRPGSRVAHFTIYANAPYFGFSDLSKMSTGISFVKRTKTGIFCHRSGASRWYFGSSSTLTKAVSNVRTRYGLKMSQKGWERLRVKAYNTSLASEIVSKLS